MNWINLDNSRQLNEIIRLSETRAQVIFKHSTRCATSSLAKNRLEKKVPPSGVDFYFLDLIRERDLSDKIASEFNICHESPQVLLIRKGECIYEESHNGIQMEEINEQVQMAR